jgi:hypothetical protein
MLSTSVPEQWVRVNRNKEETRAIHGPPNLIADVKRARFWWLGHVTRMYQTRLAKKTSESEKEGR